RSHGHFRVWIVSAEPQAPPETPMNILLRPIRALACLLLLLETAAVLAPVPASATTLTVGISDMGPLLSTAPNGQPDGVLGNILSEIAHQEHWIGMQYMYRSGYNPHSMADFFEVMHRSTSRLSFLPDFWFTHPLTTERMSEARLRANQLPAVKPKLNDQD